MSLKDAVDRFVADGSQVAMGLSLETAIPFAAGHEIIRRNKRRLTLIGPISDILFDQIVGAGCAAHVRAAWVGNVITGSGYNFRRAIESKTIDIEDHSNLTMAMALQAGAMGVPFMPCLSALGSDLFTTNSNIKATPCPFTGRKVTAVAAICPDVTIVHVQKADRYGNALAWGNMGVSRDACMAGNHVIITAETIVSGDQIERDPNRVICPGFKVNAVVHAPWGAYPSPMPGFYNRDHQAFIDYRNSSRSSDDFDRWLRQYITDLPDHAGFIEKIGESRREQLKIQNHLFSEAVDYGY